MAPTATAAMDPSQDLSLCHKLRKPVVEKLRRERINSSIEQLKSLLCTEFLQQQSDSKLEKADILEMTVTVLTRLQQPKGPLGQGFSRCARKLVHVVSKEQVQSRSPSPVFLSSAQSTVHSSKEEPEDNNALWRPW
ncbi:unnamed protein product [Knipowitschia caucasica]|uniref:BHLH domain-containing protein n=1 Tax=Knipowitschia caucasica TaxID=637954 RepID=A0AAV2M7H4_KNICA